MIAYCSGDLPAALTLYDAAAVRYAALGTDPMKLAYDQAQALLQQGLAGRAEIYRVQDLIEQGFFGTTSPSAVFMSRVGNLVILPYAHETVWWYQKGRFEQNFYGSHGGLSREEMETLLLALPYG